MNGPLAFPMKCAADVEPGMSLLDYFAAKAMPTLIALSRTKEDREHVAFAAYKIAHDMLQVRDLDAVTVRQVMENVGL